MKLGGKYRSVFPSFCVNVFLTLEIKQTLWTDTNTVLLHETFCTAVKQDKLKEARKGIFVDVVFAKRLKITKKDI